MKKDEQGRITKSVISQIGEILLALQTQNSHLIKQCSDIDDVIEMHRKITFQTNYTARKPRLKSLSEILRESGHDSFRSGDH